MASGAWVGGSVALDGQRFTGMAEEWHVPSTYDTRKALLPAVLLWMRSAKSSVHHLVAVILGVVVTPVCCFLTAPRAHHTHCCHWVHELAGCSLCLEG